MKLPFGPGSFHILAVTVYVLPCSIVNAMLRHASYLFENVPATLPPGMMFPLLRPIACTLRLIAPCPCLMVSIVPCIPFTVFCMFVVVCCIVPSLALISRIAPALSETGTMSEASCFERELSGKRAMLADPGTVPLML